MKFLLRFILKWLAIFTLARYRPMVVGVTGSVGKTGTRAAITLALAARWRTGGASKNLNNEIGLPLAILGEADSGYRSAWAWLCIIGRACRQLFMGAERYPEVLVLEYGVDHVGDMDYLLSIARPEVAIVTAVSETHLEFLQSVPGVAREKAKLVAALPPAGLAVLNVDFPLVADMARLTTARVISYGFGARAQVRALGLALSKDAAGEVSGAGCRVAVGGSTVPIAVRGALGEPPVTMVLGALAIASGLGLSTLHAMKALEHFVPPAGRLRLVPGVGKTTLIDDTYNSSPVALRAALTVLRDYPVPASGRRWAVLGDMLELGAESGDLHEQAGRTVAEFKIDFLVTVGEASRAIANGALAAGLAREHSRHFVRAEEAGAFVRDRLRPGDVVLVKGSQGVRCERATRELMREPERAKEFLVRQSAPWT